MSTCDGNEIDLFDFLGERGKQPHYDWLIDRAIANAEKLGCKVVHSNDKTILLDIDNGESMDKFKAVFPRIKDKFNLQFLETWKSQHCNDHIVISCDPLPFPCRVAIASCLGSDPIREALAIAMFQDGLVEPSVLFKPLKAVTYLDIDHTIDY